MGQFSLGWFKSSREKELEELQVEEQRIKNEILRKQLQGATVASVYKTEVTSSTSNVIPIEEARPLVIPDDTEIKLRVSGREEQYLVSLDSRISSVNNNSELTVRKTPFIINMVEIPEETFLKTLRNKLLWGEDKRN